MQPLEIQYLDYYLSATRVPVEDLINEVDDNVIPAMFPAKDDYLLFAETILEMTDIGVEKELDEPGMLNILISKLFTTYDIVPGAIDLIITTNERNTSIKDSLVKYLQHFHQMTNAAVMNITGNHCANIAVACSIAKDFSGHINNVLIIDACKLKDANDRIIGAYGILGDGAGIVLLSRKPGICKIEDSVSLSNGLLHKVDLSQDYSLLHLKYTLKSMQQLMKRNNLHPEMLQAVLPQNANILLTTNAVMEYGIDIRKIFTDNIGRCGHIDTVDFIINLKDVLNNGQVEKGAKLLSLNIGWAGSYVSSLITVN
jgi:3-oxoacyl-[acyl-carrier-protein] synthase III